jgi:hypothetical protein
LPFLHVGPQLLHWEILPGTRALPQPCPATWRFPAPSFDDIGADPLAGYVLVFYALREIKEIVFAPSPPP